MRCDTKRLLYERAPIAAVGLFLLLTLAGCGSSDDMSAAQTSNPPPPTSNPPPPSPDPPPPSDPPPPPSDPPPPPAGQSVDHGRYVGTVTIDGVDYFGDAIFTDGGATHLYIGGPYTDDGTIQTGFDSGSIDFVSPARTPSGGTVGGGVIGREPEDCGGKAGSPSRRWCGRASSAEMSAERVVGSETDAIHGEITGHDETWTFDLTPWSNAYNVPARLSDLAGQYTEEVAPFARHGLVMTVDKNGRAFFQTPLSCTGNGTFTPLGNGESNVYAVAMSISSCDYPYSLYNGEYRGLATLSPSDYWGYDTNLRVWLASFSPDWSAVTMWGGRIPGS